MIRFRESTVAERAVKESAKGPAGEGKEPVAIAEAQESGSSKSDPQAGERRRKMKKSSTDDRLL